MYTEFFGLKRKPFNITPDPKFLYLSPGHKEALAHLVYALRENSGFVVITGEVGTGKTTILNAFLSKLPPRMPKVVIKNPNLKPENLYYLLGEAIGLPPERRARDYIDQYEERLKQMGGAVLIVDESQGLSVEMLEEIRLLSNLETPHEKLIQIMLLGQQELNDKLKNPNLRQLKQRIGVKYHIPPLNVDETHDYIDHRLRIAGYEPREKPLFTPSAMGEVYRFTKGFPRLINIICDNALLVAFTDDLRQVTSKIIKSVATELEETYGKGPSSQAPFAHRGAQLARWRAPALALVALLLVICAGLLAWHFRVIGPAIFNRPAAQTAQAVTPPEPPPPTVVAPAAPAPSVPHVVLEEAANQPQAGVTPPVPPTFMPPPAAPSTKVITVRAGDTVAGLAADYYGRVTPAIIERIRQANPALADIDLIHEGDRIELPAVTGGQSVLYSVSVAAYHSISEAQAVFSDLSAGGHEATIYPYMDGQQNRWFRITIGTFSSRTDALEYARDLKDKGFVYAKAVKISMEE